MFTGAMPTSAWACGRSRRKRASGRDPRFTERRKRRAARGRGDDRGRLWVEDSGDDRLSRRRHYHGPGGLNGRVRDGNGCGPASMVAGKSPGRRSGRAGRCSVGSVTRGCAALSRHSEPFGITVRSRCRAGGGADGSGWSSCSAVRTGRLRRSPAVHARPIDLVVFQEPTSASGGLETSSWRGLRA